MFFKDLFKTQAKYNSGIDNIPENNPGRKDSPSPTYINFLKTEFSRNISNLMKNDNVPAKSIKSAIEMTLNSVDLPNNRMKRIVEKASHISSIPDAIKPEVSVLDKETEKKLFFDIIDDTEKKLIKSNLKDHTVTAINSGASTNEIISAYIKTTPMAEKIIEKDNFSTKEYILNIDFKNSIDDFMKFENFMPYANLDNPIIFNSNIKAIEKLDSELKIINTIVLNLNQLDRSR